MSDHLSDTPVVIPAKCPGCYPDDDPVTYDVRYCEPHFPGRDGLDDRLVDTSVYITNNEGGGEDNRAWCDFIHRRTGL